MNKQRIIAIISFVIFILFVLYIINIFDYKIEEKPSNKLTKEYEEILKSAKELNHD